MTSLAWFGLKLCVSVYPAFNGKKVVFPNILGTTKRVGEGRVTHKRRAWAVRGAKRVRRCRIYFSHTQGRGRIAWLPRSVFGSERPRYRRPPPSVRLDRTYYVCCLKPDWNRTTYVYKPLHYRTSAISSSCTNLHIGTCINRILQTLGRHDT